MMRRLGLLTCILGTAVGCSGQKSNGFKGGTSPTPAPTFPAVWGTPWGIAVPKELPPVDVAGMQLVWDCTVVDRTEDSSTRLECPLKVKSEYVSDVPYKHALGVLKSGGNDEIPVSKAQSAAGYEVAVLGIALTQLAAYSKIVPVIDDPNWTTTEVIAATKGFALTDAFVAQAVLDDKEYLAGSEFRLESNCAQGLAKTASGEWFCSFPDDLRIWPTGAPERGTCGGQALYRVGNATENRCSPISDWFAPENTACPDGVPTAGAYFLVLTETGTCARFARKSHR